MDLKVEYGSNDFYVDITRMVIRKCFRDGKIKIPADDAKRAQLFGDPSWGVLKNIKLTVNGEIQIFESDQVIGLSISELDLPPLTPKLWKDKNLSTSLEKLNYIHRNLEINGGSMVDELPEQLLTIEYIPRNAKVLELGSNIGRNTLVISSILDDESNLVTLECDPSTAKMLRYNRDLNRFKFQIENSALSMQRLFLKGWDSFTEASKPDDAIEVNTITWKNLQKKYRIEFDTLVIDCEGALYYILMDMPKILRISILIKLWKMIIIL